MSLIHHKSDLVRLILLEMFPSLLVDLLILKEISTHQGKNRHFEDYNHLKIINLSRQLCFQMDYTLERMIDNIAHKEKEGSFGMMVLSTMVNGRTVICTDMGYLSTQLEPNSKDTFEKAKLVDKVHFNY